jgi:CheY-like chemotaxis protein
MENIDMDKAISEGIQGFPVRILVVDDHPNIAATLARAISQLRGDINVIPATSGKQALELANKDVVDVLITDMMMPGMNGLELIEHLHRHPAGRPLHTILMTAYDVPGLKETARRLNVQETIIKPVPPERICQIVKQVLDSMGSAHIPVQMAQKSHSFKILIADDIPDNVTLVSRYIKNEGYAYVTAANGIEVLQKTRQEMPDLILLDVNMPEKDGFTALKELRADPEIKHIPVIILTAARPSPSDIELGLNLGADDYVTKPFDKRELLARIRTKLRVKEMEDLTRRRNRELSVLPEIGKELSARLDINELSDVVLHRAVETLGAMMGHIIILDPKGPIHKQYCISATVSLSQEIHFPVLNDLIEQIKDARQGLIIDDTRVDSRWKLVPDNPSISVTIAPMFGHLDLIGLLILTHEQANYFKLEHLMLLQAIAGQAAIAVENIQLYMGVAQEQQRLSTVLQSVADPILMFDAYGCLSLLNPTAEKLFTDYQTKLGLPLIRNCGYDKLIEALEEALSSGESKTDEIPWPDQRVFTASFTLLKGGGCVVILHDVSHFKTLEKVKNEFIATASHDLKNPITTILGFSDLISKAGPLNENQLDFANRIHSSAENMSELVQNLLELAKMDTGVELKRETVDLNELMAQVRDEFEPQAQIKKQALTFQRFACESAMQGDPFQLRQALRNLVGNAIKYTPANGTVSLAIDAQQYTVMLHVRDTGYGIPEEDLPHIFDRFYRVRSEAVKEIDGNGLGLAIVKSIIEKHEGQVSVESELGKGSCFTVALPISTIGIARASNIVNNPV